MRKSQITPERKQRKKRFFNSICTPPEHPDSPQNLYLWAFSQFSPLLKLNVSIYILCSYILSVGISGIYFPAILPILKVFGTFGRHFRDIFLPFFRNFTYIPCICFSHNIIEKPPSPGKCRRTFLRYFDYISSFCL